MEETYTLKVTKTDEGVSFVEEVSMQEFELMGVLTHILQLHSTKLEKQIRDYENSNNH